MTDDGTLGGYERVHERPAAFEGADGRAYSVDILIDDAPDADGQYGAALLFVRWARGGDRAEEVLQSACVASGDSMATVEAQVRALPLQDVKRHLDATIARQAGSGRA